MLQNNSQNSQLSILNPCPSILKGPDLLHELVPQSSDVPALEFLENGSDLRSLDYEHLHSLSNVLASKITRILSKLGRPSPIIPVFLPQCPKLYITLLAILKAGKAFCPLNLDTPSERLKFILQDVSADLIITVSDYRKHIQSNTSIHTICADLELTEQNLETVPSLPHAQTNDLAYVLYTSGSTGLPKAVSVSHRAVTQSLQAHDRHIPAFSRFLQFAAPTFDVSIFEIFFPWFRGRTLVGCTRAQMLDDLPGIINGLEVDALELTPTVVDNLLHGRSSVPKLKLLLTIGEMLTQRVVDEFGGNEDRESILWGMYGPTEAAIHCTLRPSFQSTSPVGIIGVPLDTVSALIIAPITQGNNVTNLTVLPLGEVGELVIGGPQVAEEYLNRPELTSASFIDHPEYGRLYRTGDLAKLHPDGNMECLGRVVAGQVKLRGQRVELGEIEKIMMKVDGCRTVTVMIIEETLIAFCATGSSKISSEQVLQLCQTWLPTFMVPSEILFVPTMPQLPSGKVDRGALRSFYQQTLQRKDVQEPDADDAVGQIVLRVIGQQVKRNLVLASSSASVGLDSLQSIRVASALRHEGYNVGAIDILTALSLADLITTCRNRKSTAAVTDTPNESAKDCVDIKILQLERWREAIVRVIPCTPLQEAMLAESIARPSAYCNWIEVQLSHVRSYEQIRDAIVVLVQANEILRTGFHITSQDAEPFMQIVWKELLESQIREVPSFSRPYSLGSDDSFLRPLAVQVKTNAVQSRLLFQIHHALYDGWSFDLLLQDLDIILQEKEVARRPQYSDIVNFYLREQGDDDVESDRVYWTELLRNPVSMALPNYNGKIIQNTGVQRYSRKSAIEPACLFKRANELAINPQVFFQAATAYIMSLYASSSDVILGNVTSGRTVPVTGVEDIIGPCIASLPFRLDFKALANVQDLLAEVQRLNRVSLQHCTLPSREISRAAGIRPGDRLFDVLFVWQQSLSTRSTSSAGAQIVDSADDLEYKVTLEFEPHEDSVSFRATFDSTIIPKDQIEHLSRQIDEVVELFLGDVNCKTVDIPRCFADNSRSIANPSPNQTRSQNGLTHAVEKWAIETPLKQAIIFGHVDNGIMRVEDSMTYSLLNTRANQLAHFLSEKGVGQDHLVGVIMEKSLNLYVSFLAILKLGAGYLPLVPDTPSDRISTILDDAQVGLCISESSSSASFRSKVTSHVIDLDLIDLSGYPSDNMNTPYDGLHIAYAVFTSGSTGTPKGVLVTQENLMSNLEYLSAIYPFTPESRLLQACSQAFDVSVFEIFFSWHVGICLCTARKDDLFRDLESSINELGVTHLSLTPTVAALVDPQNVPKVQFLVTAGEALTERVRRKWTGRGLYQGYGPSETTNICTVNASFSSADLINNIGPPFDNTSAFVLDPDSECILPRGAVGELCFGGTQVFRGYLNRPELNAVKIINHPLYGRIYRSGDMGILLPDNCILFTGRSDDQVKIRGQRVELGEITSIVLDHEAVRDCATLLVPGTGNANMLINFWVPSVHAKESIQVLEPTSVRSTTKDLFSSLSRQLPNYMVPSHLIPISRIPMTPQAKIDKRLLCRMIQDLPKDLLSQCAESNSDEDELDIISEWGKEVVEVLANTLDLQREDIRQNSSFFNLGLDSISAIRFCNGLRKANLGDFSVSQVLKNPTIAHLMALRNENGGPDQLIKQLALDITQVFNQSQISQIQSHYQNQGLDVARILPCTSLQEAMLSSGQSTSGPAYCNVTVFDLKCDVSRLQRCWKHMAQRHEIFRTSFMSTDDASFAFAQVIMKDYELYWHEEALGDDLKSATAEVLSSLLKANKPPVYLKLVRETFSTKLLFCCHHALYDGIAVSTLLKEIEDYYSGRALAPPITYDIYLEHMLSQDYSKSDAYWINLLKDYEPTYFPRLTGKNVGSDAVSGSVMRSLQVPLCEVQKASQRSSVSVLSMIQATWARLLHFYTGENDVCFGNIVSGRALPGDGLERLVAPCFNTLPVRVNFDFSTQTSALVDLVHATNVDSLPFQLTPLRRIQNITLGGGSRLFDSLIILQQPSSPLDSSIWTLENDIGDMDVPIVCEVHQDQVHDSLELNLHFQTSLLSKSDAMVVAETFDHYLSSLVKVPQAAANDTRNLPVSLRAEYNLDFKPCEIDLKFLHSGFERNAATQPDAIALDFLHTDGSRTTWSFKTLNSTANNIAYALLELGVSPEDIIPIHMSKSPEYYASILGVLKAGAAFAPIHTDLPEARKQFMLAELNARVVLGVRDHEDLQVSTGAKILDINAIKTCRKSIPPLAALKGSNLAYCLFTSGSTGIPKAVAMEHRSPMQTIESSRSLIPWTSSSRLLQYAAITFDMCYYDCFLAWTFGFTLCAAEQSQLLNELPSAINTLEADLLDLTPSVAVSLKRSMVPGVNWLYCIGEAMSSDIVYEWDGACVNSYGPTEAAFCTTIYPISKEFSTSVIGKPFPSTSFAVFSPEGDQALPVLSLGELYIGGAQLARGYLGKPDLTEQRFVSRCGQRFYKSGDIVRMLGDGNFEFIGRADDQVKIRGLRVELGEINHVLQQAHPDIVSVVTQILKKDSASKEQLVAFVVTCQPCDGSEQTTLRRSMESAANNQLPAYMVPQFYIFIDKFPRSMAGKIDKNALTTFFRESAELNSLPNGANNGDADRSWTEVELQVRDIFARLSKTTSDDISAETTIYQLGLDSISAVQIAAALRRQGNSINAADVMRQMTCAGIARYLSQATDSDARVEQFDFAAFEKKYKSFVLAAHDIKDEHVVAVRPCTPLQKGMLSQFLAKEGAVYLNHVRLHLASDTDLEKLESAWRLVMERHIMLRTGFTHGNDQSHAFIMIQYTPEAFELPWTVRQDTRKPESTYTWLEKLQGRVLKDLQSPPWHLRVVKDGGFTYLDIAILHTLFDADSLQSIFSDVVSVYSGQSLESPSSLDPVISHILGATEKSVENGKEFWKKSGKTANPSRFPNLSPLRYDPIPPAIRTKQATKSLREIEVGCRTSNISLQAAGIASWLSLLSAYTGEQSVTCGVVLSGRDHEQDGAAVFPCINTIPFACAVNRSKKELLDAVMAQNAEIQQYQFTPLNEIQILMGFPNESLFDTIFAYQKLPNGQDNNYLWTVVDETATTEYPVSIELEPKQGGLEYRLTYLPHVIPHEQAELILKQLDHLMETFIFGLPETKDLVNSSIYSITPAKESALPSDANLLHEFVEITAREFPDRDAFEFVSAWNNGSLQSKKWTYADLDAEGNRIATLLISHGIQPGELVGVCFEKCPEASFAMLGILKAGSSFVAIDPGAPAARQTFIVQDSQARLVLSMAAQSAKFKNSVDVPILNLDQVPVHTLSSSKPILQRPVLPEDRSYCLYTSGTTGTPKGCELTHENAIQALLAFQRLFSGHWDEKSRWLQFASFHFDVSVLEQYWSWSVGICVVSAPRDLIFEDLAESIKTLDITHIDLTPSLAQLLHPGDVPSLCKGVFITGGESLKQEILDVWGPTGVIYNGYGPTEATIGVTMYPRVPANGKPSNIGPQFENVGSYVLRPRSDIPVLRGSVGELCVSGKLVGKGYLNRPDLTADRFPFLSRFQERVYRTGDLVRILHDGTFDFLGRADDQVKLRGQRLEVGEINSVIRNSRHDIADVATLVLKHPKQQKEQLVSFIVRGKKNGYLPEVSLADAAGTLSAKQACQDKLPPYMVPTHFIPLKSMPLNVNNKADGRRLKDIYNDLSYSDLQDLAETLSRQDETWSEQELRLRHVIQTTLDVNEESVGKNTSFFELGMDSISVIGVSRAIKKAGFGNATASTVMRYPTISRVAKALKAKTSVDSDRGSILAAQQAIIAIQHRHRRTVAQALSIESSEIEALAPCTPLQQGMIARYLESGTGLYFNSFVFRLSESIDEERLLEAWQSVYAATQVLRTAFVDTTDGYLQVVKRQSSLTWTFDSVTKGESTDDCLERLRRSWVDLNASVLKQPFEIISITTSEGLLLVVHAFHGLYDGISIDMTFNSVCDAYQGRKSSETAPSFHAALSHGPLRIMDGAKRFWLENLSRDPSKKFPRLTDGLNVSPVAVTRELGALPAFESTRRTVNVTAQAIAQACWLSVLQRYIHGPVATGLVVSGRSIDFEGADQVVGPMFNTIPYQFQTQRGDSWGSIIKRVHEFNTSAHSYQHTPLRDIVKWLSKSPGQPLFDNLFVYQVAQENGEWAKNDAWELLDGGAAADYPLAFEVEQKPDNSFTITLVAQGHISDQKTSNELLDQFEDALRQAITDPSATLDMPKTTNGVEENGVAEETDLKNGHGNQTDIEWTQDAVTIKEEIASLSGSKNDDIHEMTSIFELGLDSIDAIKLSSKLKKLGINLPVSGIMRGRTIAGMLEHIRSEDKQEQVRSSDSTFNVHRRRLEDYLERNHVDISNVETVLPLTPLQEAMVAEMITSEYQRYYNFDVMKLDHDTDVEKLRNAWSHVIEASPILRTSFQSIDDPALSDSFAQIVLGQPHDFVSVTRSKGAPNFPMIFDELRKAALEATLSQPPLRVLLVEAPGQSYLVLAIAHALYDGWSLGLLHSDVQNAYYNKYAPRPRYEPLLSDILSSSGDDAAAFWQDFLSGAKCTSFPARLDVAVEDAGKIQRREQRSNIALSNITSFAKKSNFSIQTLGQSAFALVLASYTQSLDVTFGSVLSGREDDEASQLMFPTMNTVAIRTILHGSRSDMLQYVQGNFTSIKEWQHFPLRKALSLAGVDGRLISSLFVYQKSLGERIDPDKKLYTSVEGHSDVEYPVCVEMEIVGDALVWRCAVKEEVLDFQGTVELMDRLDQVLRQIIQSPDASVIEATAGGTSICGLPAFEEKEQPASDVGHTSTRQSKELIVLPESQTELHIRQVLAAVSKTSEEEITRDMSIFHIGLDSISAIKVSSLLRKQNIVLNVGDMLRAGSLENMARIVDARPDKDTNEAHHDKAAIKDTLQGLDLPAIFERAGIKEADAEKVLPITAGQLYMLSIWLKTAGTNFYPMFTYNLHGTISFEELKKSWQTLVQANPILRTTFVPTSDQRTPYVQVISQDYVASVTDLSALEDEQREIEIKKLVSIQPWVHLFVSRKPGGWDVRLKIHHALYDGVSLPLLMQQFQHICNGGLVTSPGDTFTKFISSVSTKPAQNKRRSFWTKYLEGMTNAQELQVSPRAPSKVEVFKPAIVESRSLETLARKHGVSVQSLFLAAYAKIHATAARSANQTDIVIGIYLANRASEIDSFIAAAIPTVNLLPLRITSPLEHTLLETAAQVQVALQDISVPEHACASLTEIYEWAGVKVDTFVNFLSLPDTEDDENAATCGGHRVTIQHAPQWEDAISRVCSVADSSAEIPEVFVDRSMDDAYMHVVDVEATLRNGRLDVGLFAREDVLSLEEGEKLVAKIGMELEGLSR
ncbi:hypothetical protein IQ07DRAFT_291854 [Pyrenochaeta sp. DS3sAY3a]|nr:hypothetical protein IQ07DRAFT_291854 [Pyrenochaeta sp. DS3sAY3a]